MATLFRFTICVAARSCSGSIRRPTHLAERQRVPGSGTSSTSTRKRTPPSSARVSTTPPTTPSSRRNSTSRFRCSATPTAASALRTAPPIHRRRNTQNASRTSSTRTAASPKRIRRLMRKATRRSSWRVCDSPGSPRLTRRPERAGFLSSACALHPSRLLRRTLQAGRWRQQIVEKRERSVRPDEHAIQSRASVYSVHRRALLHRLLLRFPRPAS
jgi:hypothetical protein